MALNSWNFASFLFDMYRPFNKETASIFCLSLSYHFSAYGSAAANLALLASIILLARSVLPAFLAASITASIAAFPCSFNLVSAAVAFSFAVFKSASKVNATKVQSVVSYNADLDASNTIETDVASDVDDFYLPSEFSVGFHKMFKNKSNLI